MNPLIQVQSVALGYGKRVLVDQINLTVKRGDFIAVVGPNGSGKTTFLNVLLGLHKPLSGSVVRHESVRFGYCMQRQAMNTGFPLTVREMIMMLRVARYPIWQKSSCEDEHKVEDVLQQMGITSIADKVFTDLSGGQKQRALLARTLVTQPSVLVLDEPTADLDLKVEREILRQLKHFTKKKGMAVIMVTHELHEVLDFADTLVFLFSGGHRVVRKKDLNSAVLSSAMGFPVKLEQIRGKYVIVD